MLVAGDAGKGRSLALLTDSGWHWGFMSAGEGDDGRAFQRFWENAIRWLVRDPALTLLRLELDRLEYRRNQPIAVRVRAMHADYSPAPGVEVSLAVNRTDAAQGKDAKAGKDGKDGKRKDGKPAQALRATTDADGEAHVDVGALPPGAYRLSGRANVDGRSVTHEETFVVRAGGPELDDVAARDKVLREIAQVSGGSYAAETLASVAIRPSREVRIGRQQSIEIWSTPLLLLLGIGLLTLEWFLRRRWATPDSARARRAALRPTTISCRGRDRGRALLVDLALGLLGPASSSLRSRYSRPAMSSARRVSASAGSAPRGRGGSGCAGCGWRTAAASPATEPGPPRRSRPTPPCSRRSPRRPVRARRASRAR